VKLLLDLIIENKKTFKNAEILTDGNKLYFTISIALYSTFFKSIKSSIYKAKLKNKIKNDNMILKSTRNKLNRTKYCIADKPDFLKNTVKIYLAE